MGEKLHVCVVYSSAPRTVTTWTLTIPHESTVADALRDVTELSHLMTGGTKGESISVDPMQALRLHVWGRSVGLDTVLRDGDRLEITRPLTVDPKVARRERFARQGKRGTGLFSLRRPSNEAKGLGERDE